MPIVSGDVCFPGVTRKTFAHTEFFLSFDPERTSGPDQHLRAECAPFLTGRNDCEATRNALGVNVQSYVIALRSA